MTDCLYTDILGTCLSFLMGGLSIAIAIFTLSAAFIISKRDMRNDLEQQINEGGVSLSLTRRINAINTFINRMRKITNNCVGACIVFVVGLIAYIVFRCLPSTWWIMCLVGIIGAGMIHTLYILYLLFRWYFKTFNN